MSTIGLYISMFIICSVTLRYVGILYKRTICQCTAKHICISNDITFKYLMVGMFCLSPLIFLYGFRYGIGTDYYAYEDIYYQLHNLHFFEYIKKHLSGEIYLEIGYYFLNKIAYNYTALQIIIAILIYCVIVISIIRSQVHWGMAILIYLCEHFAYSMNGIRFVIALSFILLGYTYLIDNKTLRYLIFILIAMCFHKSALISIIFVGLREFNSKLLNKIRDWMLVLSIICFPLIVPVLYNLAKKVLIFERYCSIDMYAFHIPSLISFKWLLHILPVILPLVIVCNRNLINNVKSVIIMRIFLLEIPFRMFGFYNIWYGRLARIPQLIEIIMIPMILSNIKEHQVRYILTIYYFCWYIFYFIYQTYFIGNSEVIPYQSIFTRYLR